MNGKQTALMAVVGMALLATVMTVSSLAPVSALSHLNLDGNFTPNNDITDSNAEEDSSHIAYEELLVCLLNVEAETEQEVQDCFESSYGGMDSSENADDSKDEEDDEEDEEDEEEDENGEK